MIIAPEIKAFINLDFSLMVRDYALLREKEVPMDLPCLNNYFPQKISQLIKVLSQEKYFIRDFLFSDEWPYLIYASYFINCDKQSLLLEHFQMFEKTNSIKRSGLNIYKKDGWCTHVIVGLYISNICVSEKISPLTIPNSNEKISHFFNHLFPKLYSQLTKDDLIVFRIGTLIHDLGVIDGVENHDIKGIKYVRTALKELGINGDWLLSVGSNWNIEDLTSALEIFVGQHTLVSKVYGELGIKELSVIVNSVFLTDSSKSEVYKNWLSNAAIISLTLFLIGDIGSVREELINIPELNKIISGMTCLSDLIRNPNRENENYEDYGIKRMQTFLNIDSESEVKKTVRDVLPEYREFFNEIGSVQRMDYLLAFIKKIENLGDAVRFLGRLIIALNDIDLWKYSKWKEINFNPDLSQEWVSMVYSEENTSWKEAVIKNSSIKKIDKKTIVYIT